ncbi:hypothetical protein ACS0TY_014271 [Phlomoides rotata]
MAPVLEYLAAEETFENSGWHTLFSKGFIEYVDTEEEETTMISMTINDLTKSRNNPDAYTESYTHYEIHQSLILEDESSGLCMKYYKDLCPQAEEIIKEQVQLLYKRHKNTAFSWLRNIFYGCFVESCDASLLLDSTRRTLSEKESDRSFRMRNFRYIETIKEALERECPGVISCSDILVLSARDGIVCRFSQCIVLAVQETRPIHFVIAKKRG